jgi:hypothetical protein
MPGAVSWSSWPKLDGLYYVVTARGMTESERRSFARRAL